MFNSVKKSLVISACLLSITLSSAVNANPKPLGFELGKASYSDVKNSLVSTSDEGINLYTNGNMLSANVYELGIEGLRNAFFIFNMDNSLAAVNLTFDKSKFDEITAQFAKKYKTIKKVRPFVGDCFAKYKDGKSTITVNAPHLSFEMNILYAQDEFVQKMNRTLEKQEKERKNKQSSML
ncbi:MAG: hypothetical protein ACI4NE_07520 [Succinivibrio sp.]